MYARINVPRAGAIKAFYFTGTVAIPVNTIKPTVHVRWLCQSGTGEEREREKRKIENGPCAVLEKMPRVLCTRYAPGLVQTCRWKASLYGLSFITMGKYLRSQSEE